MWLVIENAVVVGSIPRACGGTSDIFKMSGAEEGLSPRMRGNREDVLGSGIYEGSIPAHAGEPWVGHAGRNHRRVYPRACGGTVFRAPLKPPD